MLWSHGALPLIQIKDETRMRRGFCLTRHGGTIDVLYFADDLALPQPFAEKASLTSTSMQARHRMPPLQFWSIIMRHSTAAR
jgi:hypothetical protein